jgi:hypothetical protein
MLDIAALALVATALLAYVNHRFFGLPTSIGVMAGALGLSLALIGLDALGVAHGLILYEQALLRSLDFSTVLMPYRSRLSPTEHRRWRGMRPPRVVGRRDKLYATSRALALRRSRVQCQQVRSHQNPAQAKPRQIGCPISLPRRPLSPQHRKVVWLRSLRRSAKQSHHRAFGQRRDRHHRRHKRRRPSAKPLQRLGPRQSRPHLLLDLILRSRQQRRLSKTPLQQATKRPPHNAKKMVGGEAAESNSLALNAG